MFIVNHQKKYLRIAEINQHNRVERFFLDDFFIYERTIPGLDDIYIARVIRAKHGLVYVDIGDQQVAVLKTKRTYKDGQYLMVQVMRERMFDVGEVYKLGSKGCRVSDNLHIVSQHYVGKFSLHSERIQITERDRVKQVDQRMITDELEHLAQQCAEILDQFVTKIKCLYRGATPLVRILRDAQSSIAFDHADTYLKATKIATQNFWDCDLKLDIHKSIFESYEDSWSEIFLNTLMLDGGGNISIAPSPIGWIVDVNGEGANPESVNYAALNATIRQINLRNLSGNIIVDFAPSRNRKKLEMQIFEIFPKQFEILGWTTGGLMEIRSAKHRPSNPEILENLSDHFR